MHPATHGEGRFVSKGDENVAKYTVGFQETGLTMDFPWIYHGFILHDELPTGTHAEIWLEFEV